MSLQILSHSPRFVTSTLYVYNTVQLWTICIWDHILGLSAMVVALIDKRLVSLLHHDHYRLSSLQLSKPAGFTLEASGLDFERSGQSHIYSNMYSA